VLRQKVAMIGQLVSALPLLALLRLGVRSDLSPQSAVKRTSIQSRLPTLIYDYTA